MVNPTTPPIPTTILGLPIVPSALSGGEFIPLVQNGVTYKALLDSIPFPSGGTPPVYKGGTTTGSANAQVVTVVPNNYAFLPGNIVSFIAGFTNTGNLSLNVDGTGAKTVQVISTNGLTNLVGNEVTLNGEYLAIVNGSVYQLINPAATNISSYFVTKTNATSSFSLAVDLSENGTVFSPEDFGAVGNGTTDDYAAIAAAIAAIPVTGGTLLLRSPIYATSQTINIGNGTNSSLSTSCALKIVSVAGGGVGPGEFGTPNFGSCFKYIGSSGSTTAVISVNGPYQSFVAEDITVNCNGLAGIGWNLQHLFNCRMEFCKAINWTNRGIQMESRTAVIAGVTQGFADNVFIQLEATDPYAASAETGIYMTGYDGSPGIGFSRNTFIGVYAYTPGNSGTRGIYWGFIDNNRFIGMFTANDGIHTSGVGIYIQPSSTNPGFPSDNMVFSCAVQGGVAINGTGTMGYNSFYGWTTGDGDEYIPASRYLKIYTNNGLLINGFCGAANFLSGCADPSAGVGSGTVYFCPSGQSVGAMASTGNITLPINVQIIAFEAYISTVPGTGTSRSVALNVNGSATGFALSYSAAQSGSKVINYTGASLSVPLVVNAGTPFNIVWQVTGSPASSQGSWSIYYEPITSIT